jgi:hypothetical protein
MIQQNFISRNSWVITLSKELWSTELIAESNLVLCNLIKRVLSELKTFIKSLNDKYGSLWTYNAFTSVGPQIQTVAT